MHDAFANGDVCGLLVLALVAILIGDRATRGNHRLRNWGSCLAGLALLGQLGIAYSSGQLGGEDLAVVCIRCSLLGGVALGGLWTVLAVFSAVWEVTLGSLLRSLRSWNTALRSRSQERRRERAAKARQREHEAAYRRAAPLREQTQRETDLRLRQAAAEQRRRDEARAAVELFYDAHAADIAELFSREQLHDYLTRHLGDDKDADRVEARARQLQALLAQLVEKVDPPKKTRTVESLTQWYRDTRVRIEGQSLDAKIKNTQLAQLYTRYVALMQEMMEDMEP